MNNATILLSSITWAIRAQKLLELRGIRSYIKKTAAGCGSCGYGLTIRADEDVEAVADYLRAADIRIKEVLA